MIMTVEGSGAIASGLRPDWAILGPGIAFAIVFALGAARFRPVRRTRKLAYALAAVSALLLVLSLVFGFQEWAA